MPVVCLTDAEAASYGRYNEPPRGAFFLDDAASQGRNRAAVSSRHLVPRQVAAGGAGVPDGCECRKEHVDATKDLPMSALDGQMSRRDVPLRDAVADALRDGGSRQRGAGPQRRGSGPGRAPIRSKGGETEWIYWGSGTARLLSRLLA